MLVGSVSRWPAVLPSMLPPVVGRGSNPLPWLLVVTQVLSASKGMQSSPLLHVRPEVPALTEFTGTARVGAGSHPSRAGLLWSPPHGCWGKLLCSPWPLPPLWCGRWGRGRRPLWSGFRVRVTTRRSDCKIKLRGAGFLCVLLLERLLRGLESYVKNGPL